MSNSEVDMKAELERLRAENEALKKGKEKGLSLKIGEKWASLFTASDAFP